MGISSVYKSLQEIFPEVDARLLRAVAIEHPKDAHQAVEVVLADVLPYISKHSSSSRSQSENEFFQVPSDGDGPAEVDTEQEGSLVRRRVPNPISSEDTGSNANGGANNAADSAFLGKNSIDHLVLDKVDESTSLAMTEETREDLGLSHGADVDQEIFANTESDKLIAMDNSQEINVEKAANVATATSVVEDEVFGEIYNANWADFDTNSAPRFKSRSVSSEPAENNQILSSVEEGTPDSAKSGQPDSGSPVSDYKNESYSFNSKEDCSESGYVNINDNPVDLLEGIIEDAKNNKKTLFSAMESVINLMKEVEHQEEVAERAGEEADKGISDILVKVEEIKRMLVHAKEANDTRAGEVYGEKAILSTEVRELQIRLLALSDERDASLAILNEMRETLESRLASAEEAIRAASLEKQEKEESAKIALAEQKVFMEKVVQESKILQEEAEENSRLQEFLMDRGRVVDTLQGEISVICQDVRLLKERFDKRLPLSHSFSSSRTTSILASSSASMKSVASDLEIDQGFSKTPMKTSPAPSVIHGESPKGLRSEDGGKNDHKVARLDDGWDFLFDDIKSIANQNFLEG